MAVPSRCNGMIGEEEEEAFLEQETKFKKPDSNVNPNHLNSSTLPSMGSSTLYVMPSSIVLHARGC